LNVAAISSCQFVKISSGLGANANDFFFAMGLYTVQGADGYCYVVNWDDWTENLPYWTNSSMNSARVCGTVAAFIGFTIMIMGWFLPCFGGAGKCIRVTIASFAIISCILVSITFVYVGITQLFHQVFHAISCLCYGIDSNLSLLPSLLYNT
jgi:hypothetical protein